MVSFFLGFPISGPKRVVKYFQKSTGLVICRYDDLEVMSTIPVSASADFGPLGRHWAAVLHYQMTASLQIAAGTVVSYQNESFSSK